MITGALRTLKTSMFEVFIKVSDKENVHTMPAHFETLQNVTVAKSGLAFTRYWHSLKTTENSFVTDSSVQSLQE